MKTIKTKRSVGIFYILSCHIDGKLTPHVYNTRECADKSRSWAAKENTQPSEISEVELFEEVIEQVPHVVERYYFVVIGDTDDGMHTRKKKDLAELEELREEFVEQRYDCSEIKLLREEF